MREQSLNYKWEATTLEGFVQQLAVAYVARRYFFYVTGEVPGRITAAEHDARMLAKFDVARSKWSRYRRRKRTGSDGWPLANVQYIRHKNFWVLLATHGEHYFFTEHQRRDDSGTTERQYRDVRDAPLVYGGYSIGWRDRTTVRMSAAAYRELKAHFLYLATRETASSLEHEFRCAPFEPYAGVTRQMFAILRNVNRARKTAGLPPVAWESVRFRRRVVRPFETEEDTSYETQQNDSQAWAA